LLSHCAGELRRYDFQSVEEALKSDFTIGHPAELEEQKTELEKFLYQRVYRHDDLISVREKAQCRVKEVFRGYCDNPDAFPQKYQARAEKVGVKRMAVEYIAGMTDNFFEETFNKMFP